jgi:hypothetical protein
VAFKNFAEAETPKVTVEWEMLTVDERKMKLNELLKGSIFEEFFSVTRAENNGFVHIIFSYPIQASKRGMLILDFEEFLKNHLDSGISVWCEPLGDKNSLRNLRGIQIKTVRTELDEI